jgi:hypothetical protein
VGRLKRFSGGLPARKARGEMLHVAIAKFSHSLCSPGVGAAPLVRAIRHDESAFIGWKFGGDVRPVRKKVNRSGNVTLFVGLRAIHIQNRNSLLRDSLFERIHAYVRKGAGEGCRGKRKGTEENDAPRHQKEDNAARPPRKGKARQSMKRH